MSTAHLFLNFPEASCPLNTKKVPNTFFYARLVSNPVINNEHYSFSHARKKTGNQGQTESTAGKVLVWHTVDQGLIPSTT